MSLLVYEQTSPGVYNDFSIEGAHTDPITTIHHGRNGDTFELELYVGRESGNTSDFTNVKVEASSLTAEDDIGNASWQHEDEGCNGVMKKSYSRQAKGVI